MILPAWIPGVVLPPLRAYSEIQRAVSYAAARGRVEDQLRIWLENVSEQTTVNKFRFDLAMPKGAVESPDNYRSLYERSQSTGATDLFRFTESNMGTPAITLYPGDRRLLISMNYSVRELPMETHKAVGTLYLDGAEKQVSTVDLGPAPGQAW